MTTLNVASTEANAAEKHHYFLIAGVILFGTKVEGREEPNIGSAPCNAIVRHDATTFPVRKLAKAQQNLHSAFIQKIPGEALMLMSIHDIVITNVSYIGEMTEDEFQQPDPALSEEAISTAVQTAMADADMPI